MSTHMDTPAAKEALAILADVGATLTRAKNSSIYHLPNGKSFRMNHTPGGPSAREFELAELKRKLGMSNQGKPAEGRVKAPVKKAKGKGEPMPGILPAHTVHPAPPPRRTKANGHHPEGDPTPYNCFDRKHVGDPMADPLNPLPLQPTCHVPDCFRPPLSDGYCAEHGGVPAPEPMNPPSPYPPPAEPAPEPEEPEVSLTSPTGANRPTIGPILGWGYPEPPAGPDLAITGDTLIDRITDGIRLAEKESADYMARAGEADARAQLLKALLPVAQLPYAQALLTSLLPPLAPTVVIREVLVKPTPPDNRIQVTRDRVLTWVQAHGSGEFTGGQILDALRGGVEVAQDEIERARTNITRALDALESGGLVRALVRGGKGKGRATIWTVGQPPAGGVLPSPVTEATDAALSPDRLGADAQ